MNINHYTQAKKASYTTVTLFLYLLHNFKAFFNSFPCPIWLVSAFHTNSKVIPLGASYIQIPGADDTDAPSSIYVIWYYSQCITQMLLSENDLYGLKKFAVNEF